MSEHRLQPSSLSLRLRILVVALVPLLLAVGLFAVYFAHRDVTEAEQDLQQQGAGSARHLAEALAYDLFSGNLVNAKRLVDFERGTGKFAAIGVRDARQWLVVSGDTLVLPPLAQDGAKAGGSPDNLAYFFHPVSTGPAGEEDPYLARPDGKAVRAQVVLVLDRTPVRQTRSQIILAAAGMGGLSLVLALVLAWRLAGWVSRPVQRISQTVASLAAGRLGERNPERSTGELGALERGVNRMADALEDSRRNLEQRVREATAELRGQKQAAEAAVQAKSRFLAAASHDLRQPLHALILLVTALRERVGDGETRRLAEHIDASAVAMATLLNSLLDLSKLDAGVVEVHPAPFPVHQVLTSIKRQFEPLFLERKLRLVVHDSSLWADSDPTLLERILSNLVANALRYTDRGRVVVGARREGETGIRLEVWDTGKGIPEAHLQHVFEEYFQLDNPGRQRDKGLGIGLAIVAKLANLLGSSVSVRSQIGRGSCFSLSLRRCQPVIEPAPAGGTGFALPLDDALVAFIDDDEIILAAMTEVFDQWGVALAAGTDVRQVRAELEAVGRAPDLILCDYRLRSGQTGIALIRELRAAFGPAIPAALLTGDTAPETIQAIDACGIPVLHKPLKPAKLRAFLSHLLAGTEARRFATAPHGPES